MYTIQVTQEVVKFIKPSVLLISLFLCYLVDELYHRDQIQVTTEATKSSDLRSDHFQLLVVLVSVSVIECGVDRSAGREARIVILVSRPSTPCQGSKLFHVYALRHLR